MRDAKFKNLKAMNGRQIWRTCRIICSHFIDYPNDEVSSHLSKTADIGDGFDTPLRHRLGWSFDVSQNRFPAHRALGPRAHKRRRMIMEMQVHTFS
jgi:hypothetical protein